MHYITVKTSSQLMTLSLLLQTEVLFDPSSKQLFPYLQYYLIKQNMRTYSMI